MNFVRKTEAYVHPAIDFKAHRSSSTQAEENKNKRNEKYICQALIDDSLGRNIVNWKHCKITLGKNLAQEISKDLSEFFLRILNPDMITVGFLQRPTWLAWNPLGTNNRNNEPQNKNICYTNLIPRSLFLSTPLPCPPLSRAREMHKEERHWEQHSYNIMKTNRMTKWKASRHCYTSTK